MPPLRPAPFFSPRNVPFWASVALALSVAGIIAWLP